MSNANGNGFPEYEKQVRGLVSQHLKLKDEPLLLAIYYQPKREKQDIFLFEVIEGFGNGHPDPERELFEMTVESTAGFPMKSGQLLHMVFTSPEELETAVREKWKHAQELVKALRDRRFKLLHSSRKKKVAELQEMISAA